MLSCANAIRNNVRKMRSLGVPVFPTITELLEVVDVVFLLTRDGRPRLEQAAEVLRARKPTFMGPPVASVRF
eukprot:SAG31_NODE_3987_length_3683_cov_4.328962_6_plen_72_part_00